jgi:tellurite resistance protein TehA-like permease
MKDRSHGLISLSLLTFSFVFGGVIILSESITFGLIYLLILVIAIPVIIYSFCSKSPCRNVKCGHVIPGLLTKVLPERQTGKYTFADWMGVMIPATIMILFTQYWLWENKIYLIIFWFAIIIGIIDIKQCVCPSCVNKNCPVKKED